MIFTRVEEILISKKEKVLLLGGGISYFSRNITRETKTRVIENCMDLRIAFKDCVFKIINHLNAELNPTCDLLALLGAHHIFHVSGIRVNLLFRKDPAR